MVTWMLWLSVTALSDGTIVAFSGNVTTVIPEGSGNAASCGMPVFDAGLEAGAFVWQDCPAGFPNGRWHLRLTAGGGDVVRYDGVITTNGALSALTPFSYESTDQLDGTPQEQTFLMRMLSSGVDGLDFQIDSASQLCLEFTAASSDTVIYQGENKIESTGLTNLAGTEACN